MRPIDKLAELTQKAKKASSSQDTLSEAAYNAFSHDLQAYLENPEEEEKKLEERAKKNFPKKATNAISTATETASSSSAAAPSAAQQIKI